MREGERQGWAGDRKREIPNEILRNKVRWRGRSRERREDKRERG